ncbi:hypothetical protein PMAYCL1PPCAC_28057, partial [Pristionchus mayeri]
RNLWTNLILPGFVELGKVGRAFIGYCSLLGLGVDSLAAAAQQTGCTTTERLVSKEQQKAPTKSVCGVEGVVDAHSEHVGRRVANECEHPHNRRACNLGEEGDNEDGHERFEE